MAFKPGGEYAQILATHNSVVMIGESVFVHGGLTPEHIDYGLPTINDEISSWMYGDSSKPSSVTGSGPLWNRDYGADILSNEDCEHLESALKKLGASRMVIAHTRQKVINQACDGMVWRIDIGMSSYYGGKLQALKISDDRLIEVIEEDGSITETGFGL